MLQVTEIYTDTFLTIHQLLLKFDPKRLEIRNFGRRSTDFTKEFVLLI